MMLYMMIGHLLSPEYKFWIVPHRRILAFKL